MAEILFFFRILLSAIFFTSAASKLRNINEHESLIREYKLIPASSTKFMAWLDSLIELSVGAALFFGVWQKATFVGGASLLTVYSLAIAINLIRGREDISCGCAGIVGEHKISWWLVLRNLIFVTIAVWLYLQTDSASGSIFTKENIIVILSTWIFLAIMHVGNKNLQMIRISREE